MTSPETRKRIQQQARARTRQPLEAQAEESAGAAAQAPAGVMSPRDIRDALLAAIGALIRTSCPGAPTPPLDGRHHCDWADERTALVASLCVSAGELFCEHPGWNRTLLRRAQVFFEGDDIGEVRLDLLISFDGARVPPSRVQWQPWTTTAAPRLHMDQGHLRLDPADEGRQHFSAWVTFEEDAPGTLYECWDLRRLPTEALFPTEELTLARVMARTAFQDGRGVFPLNPATFMTAQSLCSGGADAFKKGWLVNTETGDPYFQGEYGTVYQKPSDRIGERALAPAPLKDLITGIGDIDLDVLTYLLAQLGQTRAPLEESIIFELSQFLKDKDIRTRNKEEKRSINDATMRALRTLDTLHMNIRIPKKLCHALSLKQGTVGSYKFILVTAAYRDLFNIEYAWAIRAGDWAQHFFDGNERKLIATLSQKLLKLDHRKVRASARMAKQVGIRLMFMTGRNRDDELLVETLLDWIGELPAQEERGGHWAGRTRDRLYEALHVLKEEGVIAGFQFEHFDWETDRKSGWQDRWLRSKIIFQRRQVEELAAPTTPAVTHEKDAPRPTARDANGGWNPADGERLRRLREELHLNQSALADQLGISQAALSHYQQAKRTPSPTIQQRIRDWMKWADRQVRERETPRAGFE